MSDRDADRPGEPYLQTTPGTKISFGPDGVTFTDPDGSSHTEPAGSGRNPSGVRAESGGCPGGHRPDPV